MAGVKRGRVGVQGGLGRASVLQKVTTIVFDGNQKVHGKLTCGVDRIRKHTGPKRKNGSSKPYENGHMFAVSPDGYIRGILASWADCSLSISSESSCQPWRRARAAKLDCWRYCQLGEILQNDF